MRTILLLVGLASTAGLAACSSDTEPVFGGGNGGNGGSEQSSSAPTSSSTGSDNSGGGGAGGENTGGSGGSGTGGENAGGNSGSTSQSSTSSVDCKTAGNQQACVICFAGQDPAGWEKFKGYGLAECGCKNAAAPCNAQCADNACVSAAPSSECESCTLGLGQSAPCVQSAGMTCIGDSACSAFLTKISSCQ